MLRAPGPHRRSALVLPPWALFFRPGDPWDVLPPRPASVGEQCWPPSRGMGEIGHEEVCRPLGLDAGWRAQAVQPRFVQMQGQPLQLQCHVRTGREEWPRPKPRTQAAPEQNERPAAVTGSPLQEAPCCHVTLQQPRGLPEDLRALAEREAHPPQLMVGERRQGPAQERLAVQGQLCPDDFPWAFLPSEGRCPGDHVLGERRLPRPPRRDARGESHCRYRRQLRQGTAQVLPRVSPLAARRRAPREEGLALPCSPERVWAYLAASTARYITYSLYTNSSTYRQAAPADIAKGSRPARRRHAG